MSMNTTQTRSGRKTKVPERMEPTEHKVEDDFDDDEYDTDYDATDETDEDELCETDSEDECIDSDEDENGNLKGFIVSDNEDSDDEYEA